MYVTPQFSRGDVVVVVVLFFILLWGEIVRGEGSYGKNKWDWGA